MRKNLVPYFASFGLLLQILGNSVAVASTEAPPVIESVTLVSEFSSYRPGDVLTAKALITGGEPELTQIIVYPSTQWGVGIGNITFNKGRSTGEWLPEFESISSVRLNGRLQTTFTFSITVQQQSLSGTYPLGRIRVQDATNLATSSEKLPIVTVVNSKMLLPGTVKPIKVSEQVSLEFLTNIKDFANPIKLPRISENGSPLWWSKTGGAGCEVQGARFVNERPDSVIFKENGGTCSLNVRTIGDDYFSPLSASVTLNVPKKLDPATAVSTTQTSARAFKNCTALNKVYPGGVALPGAVNAGGKTKITPTYNKKLYQANKKSDRDKDGIACEK